MIDERGKALHRIVSFLIEIEEEKISDPLGDAILRFDKYMNAINGTAGVLYDKFGNILMEP